MGQLAAVPDEVLLAHKQIGEKTRYELHDKLAQYLELNPDALLAEPAVHAESVVVDGAALLDERQLRWQPLTDDQTPVVALDLSRRTFQALFRAGIHTVAALASLSHDDLARVRSIGSTSIAEIETKLTTYPNKTASTNTSLSPPPLASVTNEPILHAISLVRLGLPQEINAQLGAAGLHMIGQLVDDMARHSHPPATQQAVADYMAWWAEQPPDARSAEVTATDPSPLVKTRLPERDTLASLIDTWLGQLDDRPRQILRLRFGFDGPPLTLQEIGQRQGVTRERVRQIVKKALTRLKRHYDSVAGRPLAHFAALLRHELIVHEHGWTLDACVDWLRSNDEIRLGPIEPLGLLGLLCELDEQFVLWPKHNVIALTGALPETSPAPKVQRAERPPAAEPAPPPSAPLAMRAASAATPQRLAAWPNLWPDRWRDHASFMGFVTYANELLGREPTVSKWADDLLAWGHRSPSRSPVYRQRLLDCAYIVGLTDRLSYYHQSAQKLAPALAAPLAAAALRDHSVRSALARLEHAPALLELMARHPSLTAVAVQQALGLDEDSAASHLQLFHLLGLNDRRGQEYVPTPRAASFLGQASEPRPFPATKPRVSPAGPPPTARAPRAKETQGQLLLRALVAISRPAHVSEILIRATELTRGAPVPKQPVALLVLLQSDETAVFSLGEGVFSLTQWEAARARETRPVLPVCPRPWVSTRAFHDRLLESVFAAGERLRDEPTVAEFLARMLAWWGVDTGARLWVRQSVLSAYYLLGMTPFAFAGDDDRRLRAEMPALGLAEARDYCRRALGERLAAMPAWLDTLARLGPARPKALAAAFAPRHPYGLNDVEARLHLLVGLGAAERLSDGTYRPVEAARGVAEGAAGATATRLRACPALLPDRPGEGHTFLDSVVQADRVLANGPTVEQFLREMIVWAGSDYPKSETYYQNVLDAYYVVGLIERTSYIRSRHAVLQSTLPPVDSVSALRDYCIRATLERLEHGRRLLAVAGQIQPFTRKEMQEALGITLDNSVRHLRLFTNLGILSPEGAQYSLMAHISGYTSTCSTSYTIRVEHQKLQERTNTYSHEDGLELLAYLGGIE